MSWNKENAYQDNESGWVYPEITWKIILKSLIVWWALSIYSLIDEVKDFVNNQLSRAKYLLYIQKKKELEARWKSFKDNTDYTNNDFFADEEK